MKTQSESANVALRAGEMRFHGTLDRIMEGCQIIGFDWRYLYVNDAAAAHGHCKKEELLGRTLLECYPGIENTHLFTLLQRCMTERKDARVENEFHHTDGSAGWFELSLQAVPEGLFILSLDITERKRAELHTAVQHAVTAVLAEGGPLSTTIRRILEILCRRLGWILADFWTVDRTTNTLRCVEIWHPPSTEFHAFAEASRLTPFAPGAGLRGAVWSAEEPKWISDVTQDPTFRRRAEAAALGLRGALAFPIKLRGQLSGLVEFFSQQSRPPDPEMLSLFAALGTQIGQFIERQQLEDQFRQAQKMEAIGTLAGGIAHDFNNILAAIMGYTELARMELGSEVPARRHLDSVLVGSKRAVELVRQILAFSRQQEQERKPIQLRHVVNEAIGLLRATIPSSIDFHVSLEGDVSTVLADATQIHQVVMNLVANAAHAMRGKSGSLTVTLENFVVSPEFAKARPALRAGPYVRLSVSDTGHGMDEATQSRIFEPFFTMKGPGEGTGLGLAVVHGIMRGHDGAVTVYSHLGEGTTFHLYFPVFVGEELAVPETTGDLPRGQGERILYVDDEEALARMGKTILERLGYVVDARTNPLDALEAVRTNPGGYDLVIMDHMMPRMTGIELAQHVFSMRPALPSLLMTGYTTGLIPDRLKRSGIQQVLLKPIPVEVLAAEVRRALKPAAPKTHG